MTAAASTTPTIGVVAPPPLNRGPRGSRLDPAYVDAVGQALSAADAGAFISTGNEHDTKARARKHTERVKAALVDAGFANSKAYLSSRLWQAADGDDAPWVAAIGHRTPSDVAG